MSEQNPSPALAEGVRELIQDLRDLERDAEADMVHLRGDEWSSWAADVARRAQAALAEAAVPSYTREEFERDRMGETGERNSEKHRAEAAVSQRENQEIRPSDEMLKRRAISICESLKHLYDAADVERVFTQLRLVRSFAGGGDTWDAPAPAEAAVPPRGVCDCGRPLTMCTSCAVEDYQAANLDCATCCPPLPSSGSPEGGAKK